MPRSLFGSLKDKLHKPSNMEKSPAYRAFSNQTSTPVTPQINGKPSISPFSNKQSNLANQNPLRAVEAPPPPYSVTNEISSSSLRPNGSQARQPSPVPSLASVTNDEDKYAFLTTFDTIFLIDDSGSMSGRNWRETEAAIRAITPICTSHDEDGIDMYFLNHKSNNRGGADKPAGGYYGIKRADTIQNIFSAVRPQRTTPLGTRLHHILKPYIASLVAAEQIEDVKPVNIIVITDGRPSDDPESVVVQHARKLDSIEAPPYQVGLQFFQVGNDAGAAEFLRELDDDLADQGVRDMVDTTTWDSSAQDPLSADNILKVVLGAVVRRLDRKATANTGRSRT